MKLKIICLLPMLFISVFILGSTCFALEKDVGAPSGEDYYNEQINNEEIKKLWDSLPMQTKKYLEDVGIDSLQWKNISNMSFNSVLSKIINISGDSLRSPLFALFELVFIILLCSLVQNVSISFKNTNISLVVNLISTMCACVVVISPILECTQENIKAIKALSIFMLSYIPIVVGIMVTLGKSISAVSYNLLMVGAGEVIAQLSSNVILPILNVFFSLSVVSSISPRLNFKGICNVCMKVAKWILGIIMTIFVTLLSVQTVVNASADNATIRAIKFTVGTFVPVVGTVLGEAFTTIQGAVHMLKSGVGAFGILAVIFLFVPGLLKCLFWIVGLNISSGIADMFELSQLSGLFVSVSKVLGLIIAIILSCMAVFIISTLFVINMT